VSPLRARLSSFDVTLALAGAAATVLASLMAVRAGAEISVAALLAIGLFGTAVAGFVTAPHIAVAATIVVFALVPALKVFVSPEIGAVKDLLVVAAGVAGVVLYVFEGRRSQDRVVVTLTAGLLALYVANVGGSHDLAWAQGLRLVSEPLILLLVGMTLPQPQRTMRWALAALVATCCVVAGYGLLQQAVGKYALVEWGYSFESQVRSLASGQFRSFGTLDDPFAYAALLVFGIAAILFWRRRGLLAWGALGLLVVGLALSFVRTALLVLVFFAGLMLRRRGYNTSAALLVAASLVAGTVLLVNASGTESHTYQVSAASGGEGGTANVILNGRISAWQAALGGNPVDWVTGRGVGEVGTAAARATYSVTPTADAADSAEVQAVDSGYLAALADVGIVGMIVLIALLGRLVALAWGATRTSEVAGWVALAILAALLLDALTRASFTGFPTAFLGLFLVGICLSAAREEAAAAPPASPR
jgi:hypothetical protein